jgi:hypothetical protein
MEALALGSVPKRPRYAAILDFGHGAAFPTNQKLHRTVVKAGSGTGNKRIQTLDLVDQSLLHQEIKRAINRGRQRTLAYLLQSIQQLIRCQWAASLEDQPQNRPAKLGELRTVPAASLRCRIKSFLYNAGCF